MRFCTNHLIVSLLLFALASTAPRCFGDETGDIGEARVQEVTHPLIGTKAPELAIPMLDGNTVRLGALRGNKPLYLKFWATWCIPCREQMPHLQSTFEKYGDKMEVLSINTGLNDSEEFVKAFYETYGLSVPVAIDTEGRIGQAFKLTVTPQHVLIDRTGTIRYIGHLASEELDRTLAAVIADENTEAPRESKGKQPAAGTVPKSLALLDEASFQLDNPENKPTVLFFFATWCDWYLAETRPAVSARCIDFQERVRDLHQRFGDEIRVVGIAQFLWTNDDYLKGYQGRLDVKYPIGLDVESTWFAAYGVRDVPTVIVLNGKNEVESRFSENADDLEQGIAKLLAE